MQEMRKAQMVGLKGCGRIAGEGKEGARAIIYGG